MEYRRTIVTVGENLFGQGARQTARRFGTGRLNRRNQLRKLPGHFGRKPGIAPRHLGQQQRTGHLEGGLHFRPVENELERRQRPEKVPAGQLGQGATLGAQQIERGFEHLGDALAHMGDSGHHRHAERVGERLDVDVDAFFAGLVEPVEGDHEGLADLAQLLGESQVGFEGGGVDHLDQQIWRLEAGAAVLLALVGLATEQGGEQQAVGLAEIVNRPEGRKIDQRSLLKADIDLTGFEAQPATVEHTGFHRGAGCHLEDRALAGARQTDQRNLRALGPAEQGARQWHPCYNRRCGPHQITCQSNRIIESRPDYVHCGRL